MKILIIGGARFVGPYVIEGLLKKGHELTVFNRGNHNNSYEKSVKYIIGDRNDGFKLDDRYDVVIDMCSYNGKHTKQAITELKFDYYLHFGTVAAYKKYDLLPLNENSPIGEWKNWGDYNVGKLECELALKESNIKYGIIRPTYILGPANYCDRENFIYKKLMANEEIILPGNGNALMQFAFAYDVANTIIKMAEEKISENINICGDEMITLIGLVEHLASIIGKKANIKFNIKADGINHNETEFPFANENMVFSNSKLKSLGLKLTPLLEGLNNDYENYYKKNLSN